MTPRDVRRPVENENDPEAARSCPPQRLGRIRETGGIIPHLGGRAWRILPSPLDQPRSEEDVGANHPKRPTAIVYRCVRRSDCYPTMPRKRSLQGTTDSLRFPVVLLSSPRGAAALLPGFFQDSPEPLSPAYSP